MVPHRTGHRIHTVYTWLPKVVSVALKLCNGDGRVCHRLIASRAGSYLVRHDHARQLEGKQEDAAEHAGCEVDRRCAYQPHKGCQQVAVLRLRGDELQCCIPKGLPPAKDLHNTTQYDPVNI